MEIVRNISLLKQMKRANLIKFHPQTGTKITGLYSKDKFTCCYIDDRCEGVPFEFQFMGDKYQVKYFSGCFYPYVVKVK